MTDVTSSATDDQPQALGPYDYVWKLLWFLFFWQSFFHVTETALKYIIKFIKHFIKVLGMTYQCPALLQVSNDIPVTIKTAEVLLGIHDRGVIEYIVCPQCHSIYVYDDCVLTLPNGKKKSKLCRHIRYPNHPHASKRRPCNAVLLKNVPSKKGDQLIPFVTYP